VTTFRLPDWLGGAEVELLDSSNSLYANVRVTDTAGATQLITLDRSNLVEVPLPPEPSNHAAIITHGPVPIVMQRVDQRHADDGAHWFGAGNVTPMTWAQVCEFYTPTVLVPDPAAGAPALPWRGNDGSGGGELIVQSDRLLSGGFTEFGGSRAQTVARLDAVKLRELAGALLRRAAEVES
jgi:hypothetical protein